MKESDRSEKNVNEKSSKLVEGIDFYFEDGLMVLTAHFLKRRGYCCENGCLNCPYGFIKKEKSQKKSF